MLRPVLLALMGLLLAASCGAGNAPRRDLILCLAARPPVDAPAFAALSSRAIRYQGPLRAPGSALAEPSALGLRIELFTGRHDPEHSDAVWTELPSLPEAARLSGRRALGFTTPGGITAAAGFDEFARPGRASALEALEDPSELPERLAAALETQAQRAREGGLVRAPLLLVFDLGSAPPDQLEPLLESLERRGLLATADTALYFTDADASTRLLLAGPDLSGAERRDAVDPRDLFPTLARLGRIPMPGILQGRDLLE